MPSLPSLYLADLTDALARGAARNPGGAPGGVRWLLLWATVCALTGVALYLAGGHLAGFLTLNAAAGAVDARIWQGLTMLGDERVACALALLFARRHPRVFWTLLCAALVGALYSRGLKPLLDVPRPPAVLVPDAFTLIGPMRRFHSFPSGHSVTAGLFFGVLVYFVRGNGWRALFMALAVGVGLSRVAVGVHWPVDVAAGLTGGLLAVPAGAWLARRWRFGLADARVHLALVTLAAVVTIESLIDDGGYSLAAPLVQALAVTALTVVAIGYLLLPALRLLRAALRRRGARPTD